MIAIKREEAIASTLISFYSHMHHLICHSVFRENLFVAFLHCWLVIHLIYIAQKFWQDQGKSFVILAQKSGKIRKFK